jgi:hypothetical protein
VELYLKKRGAQLKKHSDFTLLLLLLLLFDVKSFSLVSGAGDGLKIRRCAGNVMWYVFRLFKFLDLFQLVMFPVASYEMNSGSKNRYFINHRM